MCQGPKKTEAGLGLFPLLDLYVDLPLPVTIPVSNSGPYKGSCAGPKLMVGEREEMGCSYLFHQLYTEFSRLLAKKAYIFPRALQPHLCRQKNPW